MNATGRCNRMGLVMALLGLFAAGVNGSECDIVTVTGELPGTYEYEWLDGAHTWLHSEDYVEHYDVRITSEDHPWEAYQECDDCFTFTEVWGECSSDITLRYANPARVSCIGHDDKLSFVRSVSPTCSEVFGIASITSVTESKEIEEANSGDLAENYACPHRAWFIKEEDASGEIRYPIYGILDCADEPSSITSTRWMEFACDGCTGEERTGDITIECALDNGSGKNPSSCVSIHVTGPPEVIGDDFEEGNFLWNGKVEIGSDGNSRRVYELEGHDTAVLTYKEVGASHYLSSHPGFEDFTTCDDGSWVFADYPDDEDITVSMDCADTPLEVTAPWVWIRYEDCEPWESHPQPTLTCTEWDDKVNDDDDKVDDDNGINDDDNNDDSNNDDNNNDDDDNAHQSGSSTSSGRAGLTESAWVAISVGILIMVITICLAVTRIVSEKAYGRR